MEDLCDGQAYLSDEALAKERDENSSSLSVSGAS
jgi:hypothetical protein